MMTAGEEEMAIALLGDGECAGNVCRAVRVCLAPYTQAAAP